MTKNKIFNKTTAIKKVTALFYKKGYFATSMQDIVDATKLNRSSIYNSFGSKLELFVECFKLNDAKYKRDIQKIIISQENAIKSLHAVFELSIKENNNGYLIPNYIPEMKNDEPIIKKMVISQQEYMLQLFEDIIKKGQRSGNINNSKSERQYALFLLSSFQGLKVISFNMKNQNDLHNIIYNALSILE